MTPNPSYIPIFKIQTSQIYIEGYMMDHNYLGCENPCYHVYKLEIENL
jgi:hypothetical protein